MDKETQYEPLGSYPKEVRVAATEKVHFNKIGGVWVPIFTGNNLTHRDRNLILRSLQVGFRRYTQLSNMKRRQQKAEVENASIG